MPADLVLAVHAAAFFPTLSRFCEPCCMLRSPMPVPRNLFAAVQPPPNWHELTPCGCSAGHAPVRCTPAPALAAAALAEPPKATAPALPEPPVLQHLPRPSIRELLSNELRASELWTDLPAALRKGVARLLCKMLAKIKDAQGPAVKNAAFLDLT
jgi:hypothetical protein